MNSQESKSNILSLLAEAVNSGARKAQACKMLDISLRTLQRWNNNIADKRSSAKLNPHNKLSDKEIEKVIEVSCSKEFRDKTPNEIVPLLAQKGKYYASESTFYRILRSAKLLAHRTNSRPKTRKKPLELKATGPNQVWSWDITYLKSNIKGQYFYLYLFMDVWSRTIVGWDICDVQSSELAAQLATRICKGYNINSIYLHADNGGPMKGAIMLATLEKLGVIPSFSRPQVSNDNPYSEALFKTVKYNVGFPPSCFNSIEEAKIWFEKFAHWYNTEHLHSAINFVTPAQRHTAEDKKILQARTKTYEKAKSKNPERWTGKTRNWNRQETVYLNPTKETKLELLNVA